MEVISVNDVKKSFASVKAVKGISFSIEKGKVFGLLGPNGAGKTTTIRMIMNIIIPDSGEIKILGEPNSYARTDLIGYLPEERGIYRKMKIKDVLLFLARLKSMQKSAAISKIDYWLERLELLEWRDKKVEELSKGMQQKLQFIATIMHDPQILIFDEPFMGLDPINTKLVKDIIMELKKSGKTIIFSTHLMDSAEKLCDEIMLVNKGARLLWGKVDEVKRKFGKKSIILKYSGDDSFLKDNCLIHDYDDFGHHVEINLNENCTADEFLQSLVGKIKIQKFEINDPSLNDIFIQSVNKDREEK